MEKGHKNCTVKFCLKAGDKAIGDGYCIIGRKRVVKQSGAA
ncbi:MAG: hypothetical protein ACK4Q5_06310 [Saprospiraceae bacterium]